MATDKTIKSTLKYGLLIAVIVVVVRIALELLGAPGYVNSIFGVAWLYFILPVVFAFTITGAGVANPLKVLFKNVLLFAIYTRIMVMITYMFAYAFKWQAPRFNATQGGTVGENVSVINGMLIIPVRNALMWIVSAVILGMIIGGITIWLRKKSRKTVSA